MYNYYNNLAHRALDINGNIFAQKFAARRPPLA